MSSRHVRRISLVPLAVLLGLLVSPMASAEDYEATSSKACGDYVRKRQADGSFVPESYAFAEGGYWSGPLFDPSIDKLGFMEIARTMAAPLAKQNYLPTTDQKATKLLLVIYWGTTSALEHANESNAYYLGQKEANSERDSYQELQAALQASGKAGGAPASDSAVRAAKIMNAQDGDEYGSSLAVMQAENRTRDQTNMRNAQMLGYDSEWNQLAGGLGGPARDHKRDEMIAELEEQRYFVVIMAYDYQMLVTSKNHKLLWEARYSIRQHDHAFDRELEKMTLGASRFFGQNSYGLKRTTLPAATVEIGPVKNLGVVSPNNGSSPTPMPSSVK